MATAGGEAGAEPVIRRLAKPAARGLAWTAVALGVAGLVVATIRNVREG